MKIFCFTLLVFCFILSDISVSAQSVETETKSQELDLERDLIHFGDIIDVDIVGSVEHDWRGTLTPEGFINGMAFIDEPVFGLCKTENEVAESVAKGFSKLLRDPQVNVRIVDRSKRPVSTLWGAVNKQQKFQIQRPVHLNELIILSGGLTDRASGEIQIFRPKQVSCVAVIQSLQKSSEESKEQFIQTSQENGSQTINIKIADLLRGKQNPQIYSGDVVTVLESEPIYVIGGVASPKRISARTRTTLSRAIASAGGFAKDSKPEEITIFRREGKETKIIEASYAEIEKNADKDIPLQPYDVIDVGMKGRGKSKIAPVVKDDDLISKTEAALPLRIID